MALVYMATNAVNGSRYIGQTVRTLQERKRAHIYKANVKEPDMVFCRAIKKYGATNFRFEVVQDNLSLEEACRLEIDLIAKYKPEYNVSSGGTHHPCGTGGVSRPIICVTDGTRSPSLKAAAEKYNLCNKTIRRLCKTGVETESGLRFMYADQGIPADPKPTRERRVATSRQNGLLGAKATSKPVVCLETAAVYPSVSEAARAVGTKSCNMADGIKKLRQVCGKYFAYHYEGFSEKDRQRLLKQTKPVYTNERAIVCLNDGCKYRAAKYAAKAYNIGLDPVYNSCQTGATTKGGLRFYYEDQGGPVEANPAHKQKVLERLRKSAANASAASQIPVICLDNGAIYESVSKAARVHGRTCSAISDAIRKNRAIRSGLRFAYYNEAKAA